MTPEEQQEIVSLATAIYDNIISFTIVALTGYGVSALGILIATHIMITKSWTRPRTTLLACLIMTFIALTWTIADNVTLPLEQDRIWIIQIEPVEELSNAILPLLYMESWSLTIAGILSDFIVVWRALVLFRQEKFWKLVLVLLMIANIGVNVSDVVLDNADITKQESNTHTILDWLSLVVSLVVNMFATGLIAWKAC
ncbi:hypothetical protein GYMLUDRAFT_249209 [Collybiopsis luxurians FD-317 M1]|uniref:Uncharacterized protein n=1 Tax=Collybiopsis luxurians FD-317 M1 TaxID=944289 RepID=A0A0D0AWB4_9AGAR|nr:hypothetical protein GYMLUDRAFT_249209 [Collybiopsis luxurians FD-317 M1]